MRIEVRKTFWVFFLAMAGSYAGIYLTPPAQSQVFYRLVYLFAFLLIISAAWALISTRGFDLKRQIRGEQQEVGQVLEERFEIINQYGFVRPWVEIRDESTLPGSNGSRVLSWIGRNERRNYSSYTLLTHRGVFQLGPTQICSGDPFGLFLCKREIPGITSLMVLPYMVDVKEFPLPAGLLPGGKSQRQKTYEVTPHAATVRDYAPGDPLNRIHWRSSARRDRLISKEFEQDPLADAWIFLDAQKNVRYSVESEKAAVTDDRFWLNQFTLMKSFKREFQMPADTFEYGVSLSASVVKFMVRKGLAVGFTASGQQLLVHYPEKGERQLDKILKMLALIRAEGRLPLQGLVEIQAPNLARGSTAVLITSSTSQQVIAAVDSLLHRDARPVVILVNAASFGSEDELAPIIDHIQRRHVPAVTISKGEDIQARLETGFPPKNFAFWI